MLHKLRHLSRCSLQRRCCKWLGTQNNKNQKADEVVARTKASNSLRRTVRRLANPNVACLLEEEDRRAIERLSLLAMRL